MSALVVDASVAIKWFFPEDVSQNAWAFIDAGRALIAPDLVIPEVCNVIWKKRRIGDITKEDTQEVTLSLKGYFDDLVPSKGLVPRAVEISHILGHPVYDCFYLALAERLKETLITADLKLLARVRRTALDIAVQPLVPLH